MKYKIKSIKVSCDGGAGTGKSTGAKMISKKFKLAFLSSGLLYRYASYLILKYKPKNKLNFLKKKFAKFNNKELVKFNLHSQIISEHSAEIAKIGKIRNILKKFQIKFSKKNKKCCIEGRDISTKILPDSDVKFFFKCSLNIAARRRYNQLKKIEKKIKFKFNLRRFKKIINIKDNIKNCNECSLTIENLSAAIWSMLKNIINTIKYLSISFNWEYYD